MGDYGIDPKYAKFLYDKKVGNSNLLREKLKDRYSREMKKALDDEEGQRLNNLIRYPNNPEKWEYNKHSTRLVGLTASRAAAELEYQKKLEYLIKLGLINQEEESKKGGRIVL
jgi:hypothetical protein|nr:MAG TPA: hypothetical protein [Caudoviricetes sp.]